MPIMPIILKYNKIIKIVVIFFVSSFLFNPAFLYSQSLLSLDNLVNEAKKNNPEILAGKKRWDASLARIPQAKSLENPNIGFTFEKIQKGTLKLDKTMPEDRMLLFTQFLPFFGKLPLKGKIAVVESQMAAVEYKNTELKIINQLKNTYYDLFMNYKEIELKKWSYKLLEGIAKVAEANYALKDMSQEDVYKIHAEIANLNNDIMNLRQENKAKHTRINTLLNRDPEELLPGIPDLTENFNLIYS